MNQTHADPLHESFEEYKALWLEFGIDDFDTVRKPPTTLTRVDLPSPKPTGEIQSLSEVEAWLGNCQRCGLCEDRKNLIFGTGSVKPKILFVGDAPGQDEEAEGRPFAGKPGELLAKIIEAMHLTNDSVYFTNIVKCRPPENRPPQPAEIETCLPFLRKQIEVLQPELIIALGLTAANALTGENSSMALLRGRFQPLVWGSGIQVLSTYHPSYLLRNPAAKKTVWEDMKLAMKRLKLG